MVTNKQLMPYWAEISAQRILVGEGFTIHPRSGIYAGSGYGVSPYPERTMEVSFSRTNPETLTRTLIFFAAKNWDLLQKSNHYIGGWPLPTRSSVICIDVSIVTLDERHAKSLQAIHRQHAIHQFAGDGIA